MFSDEFHTKLILLIKQCKAYQYAAPFILSLYPLITRPDWDVCCTFHTKLKSLNNKARLGGYSALFILSLYPLYNKARLGGYDVPFILSLYPYITRPDWEGMLCCSY